MTASLLLLFIFLAVACGIAAGYYFVTDAISRDAWLVRQRVDEEFLRAPEVEEVRAPLFKNLDQLDLEDIPSYLSDAELAGGPARASARPGLRVRLETLLGQAGLKISLQLLLALAGGLGLALGAAGMIFRGPILGAAGAAAGAAAPLLYVHFRRKARREKLVAQLPGAFDLMARAIRAGQSVDQALQAVAETFEQPLAGEFARCQKEQYLGLRPELAFHALAERAGVLEMRIFVMAMLIQQQAGGVMSEVLDRLAGLIRDRLRLRGRVRTLTAEGRLQGLTLVVLPFLIFGVMMLVNRQYAEVLFSHVSLLVATGVSMALGVLWIRKIVNFEI